MLGETLRMSRRFPVGCTPGFVYPIGVVLCFLCKEALYVQAYRSFLLKWGGVVVVVVV